MNDETIRLAYPVTLADGRVIDSAKLRRPKGRDMPLLLEIKSIESGAGENGLSPTENEAVTRLIIRVVTGLDAATLDEMDLLHDFPIVREAALRFFDGMGKTSRE